MRLISLSFAFLMLVSSGFGQVPEWIWSAKGSASGEVRFFRKSFSLNGTPASAELTVSCDNRAQVFVNGKEVGDSDSWEQPVRVKVEKHLRVGENVLAVRGQNDDGVAALAVRLVLKAADGKSATVVSDESWTWAPKDAPGWDRPGFATAGWAKPVALGKMGVGPWGDVFDGPPRSRPPGPDSAPKAVAGFKVELIRRAEKGEGSWVSMAVDPKGRLIVSSQSRPEPGWGGLLRFTIGADGQVAKTERLQTPVGAAMGLLWAHDSLYVDGEGPKGYGLYRLRFQNDQPAGEPEFLYRGANGEHGSHGLVLGPDGALYLMAGNHTKPPKDVLPSSPFRNWAEDLLLPRQWDANGHAVGVMSPGGYVIRSFDQGKTWEMFCGGFRNAYDLDFNRYGDLFTFDSDMEWDMGAPWYRPTRIAMCLPGSENGWRSGTGKWPGYYPDSLPATLDIGPGSPTGVKFGTGAVNWPQKYRDAFYAMDWAYGKLYAVHLKPSDKHSGYEAASEVFIEGKPLNLTDLEFGKDGEMYFTCGGRGTQAALYRVTWTGQKTAPVPKKEVNHDMALRKQVEKLVTAAKPLSASELETMWNLLDAPDRLLRSLARTAVELQPVASWINRAKGEGRPRAQLAALLALARCGDPKSDVKAHILEGLVGMPVESLDVDLQLEALRVAQVAFTRLGGATDDDRRKMIDLWSRLFPAKDARLNRELAQLLVFLDAPEVASKAISLMKAANSQEEELFYALVLRNGRQFASPGKWEPAGALSSWTPQLRRDYFTWFFKAEREYKGGASFKKFLSNIKKEAIQTLTEQEKVAIGDLLHPAAVAPTTAATAGHPRGFVKAWTLDEIVSEVGTAKGNAANGKKIYNEAQCALCHRFSEEGGSIGPDLTGAASRFSRRDFLEAVVDPGKVVSDQYRYTVVQTKQGKEVIGKLLDDQPDRLGIGENPFTDAKTWVKKSDIKSRDLSPISPMPPALLNLFTKDEIVDLLTYIESAGK